MKFSIRNLVLEAVSTDQKKKKNEEVLFYFLECSRTEFVLVSGPGLGLCCMIREVMGIAHASNTFPLAAELHRRVIYY